MNQEYPRKCTKCGQTEGIVNHTVAPVKPRVKLIGKDDNVFNLIGLCSRALRNAGMPDEAKLMTTECMSADSYHGALAVMMKYCEIY
jgi:hypothetical protein